MNSNSSNARLPVVDASWLKAHLRDDNMRVVDASWHMPVAQRDARSEFVKGHIPGAVFFDIDEHSAQSSLPHMLPEAEQFSQAAGALGIEEHHTIVVYDTIGLFSSARVWWMFRHFGASKVFVLNGGLPAWLRSGGELTSVEESSLHLSVAAGSTGSRFVVNRSQKLRENELVDISAVKGAMNDKHCIIMDARSSGRFSGDEKEAREGLRSGHIPGSVSVPYQSVLNELGELQNQAQLRRVFDDLVSLDGVRVLTSCGSGVTAAVLCLALACIGHNDVALYDGSWTEWGSLADTPVATGW